MGSRHPATMATGSLSPIALYDGCGRIAAVVSDPDGDGTCRSHPRGRRRPRSLRPPHRGRLTSALPNLIFESGTGQQPGLDRRLYPAAST